MAQDKKRFIKTVYKDILRWINKYDFQDLYVKSLVLDFKVLNLEQTDGIKFSQDEKVFPGFNTFLNAMLYISDMKDNGRYVKNGELSVFSNLIDEMAIMGMKKHGAISVNSYGNMQSAWQRNYIFTTYLLSLIMNDPSVNPLLSGLTDLTADEITAVCLYNKFFSEPTAARELYEKGFNPSKIMFCLMEFLIKHLNYIVIDIEDYKKNQIEKLEQSKYNLFFTHFLLKDYSIIKDGSKYYYSSYFYIQQSIFSRTLYLLAGGGVNSKKIGDAYEKIIYNLMSQCYTSIQADSLGDDCIQFNPIQKGSELCDVLIKKGDKYLLIDCKAKSFIESIYDTSSNELAWMKEKFNQRFKRIKDIKAGKYSKFFPSNVDVNNIYSLVAVVDDCNYSKNNLLDGEFDDIQDSDKQYCKDNIDIITYDYLIEFIVADVDLIHVFERIKNTNFDGPIFLNVKVSDKKPYNKCFDDWYDKASDDLLDLIGKYNIFKL